MKEPKRFRSVLAARPNGGIKVDLPFDPSDAWDDRDTYHVSGTIGGQRFRGPLKRGSPWVLELGPAWCRDPRFKSGETFEVEIELEGPQSSTIGADVAQAFRDEPEAARFFDSMPTFYRNNVARSIEDAKRADTRARRISEAVARAKARRRDP